MGVKDLWKILEDVGQERPLSNLKGKTVAIDLSIWVVQSQLCLGLNSSKKPHLKNLFYRLRHLLTNGIMPVFAIDGKPPDLKGDTIRKRQRGLDASDHPGNSIVDRTNFNILLKECQDLLDALGVPWLKSAGEAESLCGFLNSNGVVDGCITEDSDAFLYGAKTVFKDFSIKSLNPQVTEFSSEYIEKELGLNREKLVALALLLGCDYSKGVHKIGKSQALKFLNDCPYVDVLERFKQWKRLSPKELFPLCEELYLDGVKNLPHCKRCGHPGKHPNHNKAGCSECDSKITCYLPAKNFKCNCYWHKIQSELKVYNHAKDVPEFPNEEVIAEFFNQKEELSDKKLDWQQPNLLDFQEKAYNWFGWTGEASMKKTLPIITSWQIGWLCDQKPQIEFDFHPSRIVRIQTKNGKQFYKVLWQYKEENNVEEGNMGSSLDEEKCTLEEIDLFSKAYPSTTELYLLFQEEKTKKSLKMKKTKGKKASPAKEKPASKRKIQVETPSVSDLLEAMHVNDIVNLMSPFLASPQQITTCNVKPAYGIVVTPIRIPKILNDVESDDSFLDIPLTQRLLMNPRKIQSSPLITATFSSPLVLTCSPLLSTNLNELSLKSTDSFELCLLQSQMCNPNKTPDYCAVGHHALDGAASKSIYGTPVQQRLIYSVQKSIRNSILSNDSGINNPIVCTSTPTVATNDKYCTDLSLKFDKLQVSTPGSIDESCNASEELFPSTRLSRYEDDDSVICLS